MEHILQAYIQEAIEVEKAGEIFDKVTSNLRWREIICKNP